MTDFPYMLAMPSDIKKRSEVLPYFHLAMLNDLDSFALWNNVRLYESANCSTASPLSFVTVISLAYI